MSLKLKVIAGAATLIALTSFVVSRRHSAKSSGIAADGTDSTPAELVALRARLARLEAASLWQAASVNQSATTVPSRTAEQDRPTAQDRSSPKQHAPDALEYTAQLDDKFREQAPDPTWSQKGIDDAVRALSSDLTPGSRLGRVDCKTDFCRIETSHDSLAAYQSFMQSALLSQHRKLWDGALNTQVVSQSAAGLTALTFIAKEGHAVPPPEPILE